MQIVEEFGQSATGLLDLDLSCGRIVFFHVRFHAGGGVGNVKGQVGRRLRMLGPMDLDLFDRLAEGLDLAAQQSVGRNLRGQALYETERRLPQPQLVLEYGDRAGNENYKQQQPEADTEPGVQ